MLYQIVPCYAHVIKSHYATFVYVYYVDMLVVIEHSGCTLLSVEVEHWT